MALLPTRLGGYGDSEEKKKGKKREKEKKKKGLYKRHLKWYEEEYFIPTIEEKAKEAAWTLFKLYKKAHGMVTFPE